VIESQPLTTAKERSNVDEEISPKLVVVSDDSPETGDKLLNHIFHWAKWYMTKVSMIGSQIATYQHQSLGPSQNRVRVKVQGYDICGL